MKKIFNNFSKRISKNPIQTAIITVFLLLFSSCAPSGFEDYDNDEVIIKKTSCVMRNSASIKTLKKYTLNVKSFDGVVHVKKITVSANPSFNMQITINSGRFKVVAIDSNNNLYLLSDSESTGEIATTLPAGTYSIKLVGDNANVNFSYFF